jgi:O-antigen chain-terminating methyltransferase
VNDDTPALGSLRERLAQEEARYAELLAEIDRLADFALPIEQHPELPETMRRLNELCGPPSRPAESGLGARLNDRVRAALAPALERQQQFHSALVQALNAHVNESLRVDAHLRLLASTLVQYLQRLLPTVDARDRLASALATTRSELVLEAFDRRQESLARRLDGLLALRDRVEVLSAELHALRAGLSADQPAPAAVETALTAAGDAGYVAFEARFRGRPEDVRAKLEGYVDFFAGLSPVADLGCGRGEFLELLRDAGVTASGVDGNAGFVQDCRARGLDVIHADLLAFLRARSEASLGGVFAAQVAEHLRPAVLQEMLRQAWRALRPGGLLLLETVNPRSVVGLLEVYNRDLTHERPLHPETLSFLAAAAGFSDVRVELRSPVDPAARLQPVPAEGLPPRAAAALNENLERLNALLYGPQEYALLARR